MSHFLPLSLFVFPHSLPLLPAGEADSGQGACFLWPGCRSRTHLSPGRVKEHRLRNSLSPALFLWHGFLTLVSTHTLFYHINPSSLCPIVILNGLLGEQLEHDSLHPVFFTVLLSCLITSVLHGLISTYKGSLCKKKEEKKSYFSGACCRAVAVETHSGHSSFSSFSVWPCFPVCIHVSPLDVKQTEKPKDPTLH